MPSVELLQKVMGQDWDVFSDPMRPAIVIVEHKIRNLEKRKAKLDQYKAEQSQGKDLNADQLSAVSKYTEVTQQLDLARDLVKQFTEISTEVKRQIKREQRKENAERLGATTDKIRQLLFFQSILTEVNRQNYLKLMKGSSDINIEEQFDQDGIDSISSYLLPSFRDANLEKTLHEAAEHAINLIDGKPKKVNRVNDRTYKDVKEMLVNISQSDRFSSMSQVTDSVNNPVPEQSSETESVPSPVSNEPIVKEPPPPAPVVPIQESTYSFLQESTIDIESPHMDPAVVAVSSFIPPPISQTATVQRAVFTNSNMPTNHVGMNDGNLQSQMENLNMDGQITTWNEEAATGKTNKSAHNDLHDDYNNGDASNNRMKGNSRGGRGGSRGRNSTGGPGPGLNGFSRGGGYRGRVGLGHIEQVRVERIGYYKPETQEKDFDNRGDGKFQGENRGRSGHNGGNSAGSFRRGNTRNGNSSRGNGDGYRGGSDGYRGGSDGYRGGSDGYRGGSSGFRGSRSSGGRPLRTGNNGVSSEGY